MVRPLRIEFEGAWYHVMNRGAARRDVFVSDSQRERFLELLADLVERFGIETHAYCLMGNHYHLLLHTPFGNLGRGMRHLNGVYTQFFNRDQGRDGALFRGRYKRSKGVRSGLALYLICCRYGPSDTNRIRAKKKGVRSCDLHR